MTPWETRKFAKLQAHVLEAQTASGLIREELIESLGDMLCGSGHGPSPEAIFNLRRIELIEKYAQRQLSKFVAELTIKQIARKTKPQR